MKRAFLKSLAAGPAGLKGIEALHHYVQSKTVMVKL
jgi:hypothetical protein